MSAVLELEVADDSDDLEGYETDPKAITLDVLEGWLRDMRYQPAWRMEANIEADFYDGNQLDSETLSIMQDRGIAPLISNLIAPTIDVVLGMEAKSRTDWKVAPDTDEDVQGAEAMNVKLHEAERVSRADRAVSDAYAGQVKVGLGWVEVARETDPFKPKYRLKSIHRREIWWDWLAKEPDLSDARYLVRKRWVDEDLAVAHFPDHADLIRHAVSGWTKFNWELAETQSSIADRWLSREYGIEQKATIDEMEWLDLERKRVCLHEVWYRHFENGYVMKLPGDHVIEYDPTNEKHLTVVAAGAVVPVPAVLTKVRLAWWIGPHRLMDIPSPYPHNFFPYVPYFGKREDRTGVPYGLIRSMRSPQEAINARNSKMMWNLSAKRIIVDEDAVDDIDQLAEEIARPDAVIELKVNRRNENALKVEDDKDLTQQQFQILQDDKKTLQDVAGVYEQMLGKDMSGGARSGVAINSLVEQGTTTLAEINDNYRYSRILTGELLLSLVKEDIGEMETEVIVDRDTNRQRPIVLNKLEINPFNGTRSRTNNLARTRMHVELEDVPNTPTYRAQQLTQLTELTKSLPPEVQMAVIDMVIEASDYSRKKEMAEKIRNITGASRNTDDMSDEERQEYAQKQAEQQRLKMIEQAMQDAELQEAQGKARKANAEADLAVEKVGKTAAETDLIETEIDAAPVRNALDAKEQVKRIEAPDTPPAGAQPKPAKKAKKPK